MLRSPDKKKKAVREKSLNSILGDGFFRGVLNLGILIISSLVINIFALAIPLVTLQVYDRILKFDSLGTLQVLCSGVVIIVLLDLFLKLSRSAIIGWSTARFVHRAYTRALAHTMGAELRAMGKYPQGEQLHRLGAIARLKSFHSGQALISLIDLPFVAIFIGFIAYLAQELVIVPLFLLAVFGVYAVVVGATLKQALKMRDSDSDKRVDFISEMLDKIHTVKMLGLEPVFQRRHEAFNEKNVFDGYRLNLLNAQTANAASLFTQIMMVSMISFGSLMVIQGKITMGVLIACVLLSGRIMQPVHRSLSFWNSFQEYRLARKKVKDLFSIPIQEKAEYSYAGRPKGRLEVQDLKFSYSDQSPMLLKGINLSMKPGKIIALSGPPGDGKTTFLKVVAGLYSPTEGQVLIDGMEASQTPSTDLVKHIGYLPSEAVIFQGTIMDNLTCFRRELEDQAIVMANYLGINNIVSKLPHGYQTVLVDGQADLITPGMKQRITIGRVLINRPRLLLFDFADKSLDKDGYNHVFRLLGKLRGQVSMILASNDRNILHLAEKEYIIRDGLLVEKDRKVYSNYEQSTAPFKELSL